MGRRTPAVRIQRDTWTSLALEPVFESCTRCTYAQTGLATVVCPEQCHVEETSVEQGSRHRLPLPQFRPSSPIFGLRGPHLERHKQPRIQRVHRSRATKAPEGNFRGFFRFVCAWGKRGNVPCT